MNSYSKGKISITTIILSLGLLIASVLSACTPENKSREQERQGVISKTQQQALDKAKEVEDVLSDAEKARRDALEQQQ